MKGGGIDVPPPFAIGPQVRCAGPVRAERARWNGYSGQGPGHELTVIVQLTGSKHTVAQHPVGTNDPGSMKHCVQPVT